MKDPVDELMLIHRDDLGALLGDRLRARIEEAMDRLGMDRPETDAWKPDSQAMKEKLSRRGDHIHIRPHAMSQLRRLRERASHMID